MAIKSGGVSQEVDWSFRNLDWYVTPNLVK